MANRTKYTIAAGILIVALALWAGYDLLGPGGDEFAGADANNPGLVSAGHPLYVTHCASCHGARLEGQPNWRRRRPDGVLPAPPHDATGHTWHHPDGVLFRITKDGGRGAGSSMPSGMPGFGAAMTDRQIWAVLAYIKSRWPAKLRQRHDMVNARNR